MRRAIEELNGRLRHSGVGLRYLRIIDINSVEPSDGFGHDRYASLARFGTAILSLEPVARPVVGAILSSITNMGGLVPAMTAPDGNVPR